MTKSSSEIAKLKQRWTAVDCQIATQRLLEGNCEFDDFPHICYDSSNFVDLRGITIDRLISDVSLKGIDLSFATIEGIGGEEGCRLINCRFREVSFEKTVLAASAINCDFSGTTLVELFGDYLNCSFNHANMRKVNCVRLVFRNCGFVASDLHHAHITRSLFDHCDWLDCKLGRGSFAFSKFIGTCPTTVQLKETIIDEIEIVGT